MTTGTDDFEDPGLTTSPSFWATVHWRLGLGIVVCVLTGILFFVLSLFNARHPLDISLMTIGSVIGMAILWVFCRLLWAWLEWPSTNPPMRGLKAALRYLLFDVESERRAAGSPPDLPKWVG
jgi:hypothetical protein